MLAAEPYHQFQEWYAEACACKDIVDASALALATADLSGGPSVRMVLLKDFSKRGFVFYTNLESAKGRDLRENPRAALCFHWAPLRKQIRIGGSVELVDPYEADEYFRTRPRLSQLGAWASDQSRPMSHHYALEAAVAATAVRFGVGEVPRPPHWSGFRVNPVEIEFWTERPFRRHDRVVFTRSGDQWERRWLYP